MAIQINRAPTQPRHETLLISYWLLFYGFKSAQAFLERFDQARKGKGGTSSTDEQDLLRAMLTTAASALDTTVKRLVQDSLLGVISKSEGALEKTEDYLYRKLLSRLQEKEAGEVVASALLSDSPRKTIVAFLAKDLTGDSLQSHGQLNKAAAFLGITGINFQPLKDAFEARNQIIHELDCQLDDLSDMTQGGKWRRPRSREQMVTWSNQLLMTAADLLAAVDKCLH